MNEQIQELQKTFSENVLNLAIQQSEEEKKLFESKYKDQVSSE